METAPHLLNRLEESTRNVVSTKRVSVCIATCNHRDYIEQCLRSVLAQPADCILEVLIGDDASDDGTSEIIAQIAAKHPDLIHHHRHPERLGAFRNTLYLLGKAKGDYIACLDGDDYWLKGKLEPQILLLDDDSTCAAVYTNAITVREDGRHVGLFNDAGDARFDMDALVERGNVLNYSSMLFRAQSIASILSCDVPIIDYEVHLIHARFGYLAQIGTPLAAYRVHITGSMVTSNHERVREMYWNALARTRKAGVSDRSYALGITDFFRRILLRSIRTRDYRLCREWFPRIRASSPYGTSRTLWLTLRSALRIAVRVLFGLLRKGPDGKCLKILYRR
ncbi:glycosyltransferase [Oleiagrimonas soli]|nr:glycosyltransferase [Oleiagrimonas soli]